MSFEFNGPTEELLAVLGVALFASMIVYALGLRFIIPALRKETISFEVLFLSMCIGVICPMLLGLVAGIGLIVIDTVYWKTGWSPSAILMTCLAVSLLSFVGAIAVKAPASIRPRK